MCVFVLKWVLMLTEWWDGDRHCKMSSSAGWMGQALSLLTSVFLLFCTTPGDRPFHTQPIHLLKCGVYLRMPYRYKMVWSIVPAPYLQNTQQEQHIVELHPRDTSLLSPNLEPWNCFQSHPCSPHFVLLQLTPSPSASLSAPPAHSSAALCPDASRSFSFVQELHL